MAIIGILIYLLCSVGGLVLVKLGAGSMNLGIEEGQFNLSMNIKAIVGFTLYIISFLVYTFYIVKKFDLSYIFPIITGITQVLVVVASIVVLKEHVNIWSIIGIFLVISGISVMNIK